MAVVLSPTEFRLKISKIGRTLPDAAVARAQRWAAAFIYGAIVKRSPVDTGRFRANWNISRGRPDTTVTDDTSDRKHGEPADAADREKVKAAVGDSKEPAAVAAARVRAARAVWIANGLVYAPVIEHGLFRGEGEKTSGGYSRQAPEGVVKVSAAELVARFARSPELRAELETVTDEVTR